MRFIGSAFALIGLLSWGVAQAGTPLTTIRVASGLNRPVQVTHAPGDYDRVFIAEQRGVVKILHLKTGEVDSTPFLDIDSLVAGPNSTFDERGLLGITFHPDFQTNGFFYVNYTNLASNTTVARYTVSGDPDSADSGSAAIVVVVAQPFENHNGGWIGFGPNDGYLYIPTGDGGSFCDPAQRAQDITSQFLGKILRLDVDVPGAGYLVPADNPFVGIVGDDEIWAYGLRNPYRCSFDRETGDLYLGDVGQDAREEVDFQPASSIGGENYGWDCEEGLGCTVNCPGVPGCTCGDLELVPPIHSFTQAGGHCSVIGGYVYRGCAIPDLTGTYFFGDFCSNQIWSFRFDGNRVNDFMTRTNELNPAGALTISSIVSFGEDALGEIYIVERGSTTSGEIYKIVPDPSVPLVDCNENGQDDACDIAAGTSSDVNQNGVPDECDLGDFVRGDADGDGTFNGLNDAIRILDHQFTMAPAPPCRESGDANNDGVFNGLIDGIYVLSHQFSLGPPPAAPFPDCGADPEPQSSLGCDEHPGCP